MLKCLLIVFVIEVAFAKVCVRLDQNEVVSIMHGD
jgi:hypothetical protein